MHTLLRSVALAALSIIFVGPRPLAAQRIDGTLTLSDGKGAAGVLVTARDAQGAIVGRTVTRENGRYQLFVERPGPLKLDAKRVGYERETLGDVVLGQTETRSLDARLAARRLSVPENPPRGAATCDRPSRNQRFAMQAYEEILTAAAAAQFRVGRQEMRARFATTQYRIAKTSEDTLRAALRRVTAPLPAPFPPADTARLEADGFFATIGGNRTFFAPDLEVIATPWFLETHCLSIKRLVADSLIVELSPRRQRRARVDVAGEFVLDWPSLALHEFRFRYVDLPETERESGAGGAMRFSRTPAGGWLVSEWRQRTPFLNYFAGEGNTTLIRTQMLRVDVVAHFVAGGRVMALVEDGSTVFQRLPHGPRVAGTPFAPLCPERTTALPTIAARGTFTEDSSSNPLANTVIRASWTVPVIVNRVDVLEREEVRETITDANGSWFVCDLPVDREVTIRWEAGNDERRIPIRGTQAFGVVEVRQQR